MNPTLLLALALTDAPSETVPTPFARWSAHYGVVLDELAAADTSHLDASRRAARARLLTALGDYRERADFGRAEVSVPWFVDAEGRRCAVAELLHATGADALVERVRATHNHAWVIELAGDLEFERWLRANGLAFDEAARIQTPVGHNGNHARGPADTVPSGPTSPPATAAPGEKPAPPPAARGTGTGTPNTQSAAGSAVAVAMLTSDEDGWWLWWEYAKLEFLRSNRPTAAGAPVTGAYVPAGIADAFERARLAEFPRFVVATQAPEALIRGAAATALGASGGRDAVEPLLALLADPSQDVRHRALLALGATGSSKGALALIAIARHGALEERGPRISPYARATAIVALGLARRAGLRQDVDAPVLALVRERRPGDDDALAIAAMYHHVIAPSASLEQLALDLAHDEDESPAVRCRAVEALGSAREPETLARMLSLLSGGRLDLRRSAALALGATRDPSVQPALMTAFELETDPLVRGFALLAVGRIGGARGHAFLARVLGDAQPDERRWAALALGILARETADPDTAKLLRDALERERHAAGRAAYWLARGLVRDESAIEPLALELATAPEPRQRMYAATALALIGGERPAAILRARLPLESSSMTRSAIAQGLGVLGRAGDARAMRGALDRLSEPQLQGYAATALAFHGSLDALAELGDLAHDDAGPRLRRAAAIEGLGMLLSRGEPLSLSQLSRRTNYSVLPDWAQTMFLTTL